MSPLHNCHALFIQSSLILGALGVSSVNPSFAGPLTPPPGPIAPTPGPEPRIPINATNTPGDADSLFKITQPGSYYLTGNITGVANKHGIEIAANSVTLDLNGFELLGVAGSFDGVSVTTTSSYLENVSVLNGSARGWGADGIDLGTSGSGAGSTGGRVVGVHASANGGWGIYADDNQTVTECTAYENGSSGIRLGNGSSISNCTSFRNGSSGIGTGLNCAVTNCSAYNNTGFGISVTIACVVTQCSVYLNGGNGINATEAAVTNCVVYSNSGNGIDGLGSTITGCDVADNTLDGIRCSSSNVIRGNACRNNGRGGGDGAGIHATGNDNRIEGNNCTGADRGIDVDASGNFIIRNTCSGNTIGWVIAANNVVGPILDRRAPASAAISGFAAPSSLGSTDANANYSY